MNGTKLSLDAPLQLHGVELSKDQTGVTAKMKLSNYNTSVFFDGYTAQIYLTGMTNLLHALEEVTAFLCDSFSPQTVQDQVEERCRDYAATPADL